MKRDTSMDIGAWLAAASADAEQRGLPGLKPLLEGLARSTTALREADRVARSAATRSAATRSAAARSAATQERDRA